jgi:hypothetical protein
MYKKYREYINTATAGTLNILVEHKLDSLMPSVAIYEPININDYKLVPLYDARIASIESKGANVLLISFSGAFTGEIQLLEVTNDRNSIEDRLTRTQELLSSVVSQQKQLVTQSQWRQMNTYNESQFAKTLSKLDKINNELDLIHSDINAL